MKWLLASILLLSSGCSLNELFTPPSVGDEENWIACTDSVRAVAEKCYVFRDAKGVWPESLNELEGKDIYYTHNGVEIEYDKSEPRLTAQCPHDKTAAHGVDMKRAYSRRKRK